MSKAICQLYTYNQGQSVHQVGGKEMISSFVEALPAEDFVQWLNFDSIEKKDLVYDLLKGLNLPTLIGEDVYEDGLRPKIEEYPTNIFFSIRSVLPQRNDEKDLTLEQLSFVMGKNYLVSFQQKEGDHFEDVRVRITQDKGVIRRKGPDFLTYRLLEAIVDNYYEVLEDIQESASVLEKKMLKSNDSVLLKNIEAEKRRLANLRKVALPMRDLASRVCKSKHEFFDPGNSQYFDDLLDYCRGVLEEIEATHTILEGLINLYFAVQGQRMNEIMKVLTIVSTIFIPLTFMAGIYGMNFEYIPELKLRNGYFILWALMLLVAGVLFIFFRKKGWLRK